MTLKKVIIGTTAPYSHATLTWGVKPSIAPLNGNTPTLTSTHTHWHWSHPMQAFTSQTSAPPHNHGAPQNPPGPGQCQLLPLACKPRRRRTGWSWG